MGVILFGEVKLALGKRAEAETLFKQATGLGRKHWSADDPQLESLLKLIPEARAAVSHSGVNKNQNRDR